MEGNTQNRAYRHRGIALVWVAVVLTVLIGFAGLAIDLWFAVLTGQQLQNAADAAAMAGARLIQTNQADARAAAINVAFANSAAGENVIINDNPANAADGDVVLGIYNRDEQTFTPTLNAPNAIRVRARRDVGSAGGPLGLFFGPMFGVDSADVVRFAIAMTSSSSLPGIVLLDPGIPCALNMQSNARLTVIGDAHINSRNGSAACLDSNAILTVESLGVVGNINLTGSAQVIGSVRTGVDPITDPLLPLPPPPYNPLANLGTINVGGNSIVTRGPGYYGGGITLDSNSQLVLLPGIYILDGVGLRMLSNSRLTGNGVMLYIIDSTPTNSTLSRIELGSNTVIATTPPDPSIHFFAGADTYAGISIFQARNNTNTAILNSNTLVFPGALYFHNAAVQMNSNSAIVRTRLIARSLQMNSNSRLTVEGRFGGTIPGETFLVE